MKCTVSFKRKGITKNDLISKNQTVILKTICVFVLYDKPLIRYITNEGLKGFISF